ncbi:phosphatase PAP2 family protein [Marinoscillum furvescens]|uniref:Undecaprenyl-diphosphatase n=1 Tax=Marinoscillum furvescens DSM 4134 TaxID=1122208 RepID=A0A3D9L1K2_MARFU|nr:phosphatase PAP2 family protein [Marinoscillum furvescens]RED95617.1 undecaprenyl-diphosphatase [Marinoscillum furvescens DSM 4134]
MLETLLQWDTDLFLALNGLGTPHLDQTMSFLSNKYVWIPMYLYLIFRLYQRHNRSFYLPLLALILVIVCTDQITASILKPYFERLRPCKDPLLEGLVYTVGKCRGFSFASGHAANTFGLAAFFYFLEKSPLAIALLVWAALVSYSRIYLGVHYPTDVTVGALIGITFGYVWCRGLITLYPKFRAC